MSGALAVGGSGFWGVAHPTSTKAAIVISSWVKDDLNPTQETVILHKDFPSEKAEKPVAIPFEASIIEGWTEDSKYPQPLLQL